MDSRHETGAYAFAGLMEARAATDPAHANASDDWVIVPFLLLVSRSVETYCRAANRLRAPGGAGADAPEMWATSVARRP